MDGAGPPQQDVQELCWGLYARGEFDEVDELLEGDDSEFCEEILQRVHGDRVATDDGVSDETRQVVRDVLFLAARGRHDEGMRELQAAADNPSLSDEDKVELEMLLDSFVRNDGMPPLLAGAPDAPLPRELAGDVRVRCWGLYQEGEFDELAGLLAGDDSAFSQVMLEHMQIDRDSEQRGVSHATRHRIRSVQFAEACGEQEEALQQVQEVILDESLQLSAEDVANCGSCWNLSAERRTPRGPSAAVTGTSAAAAGADGAPAVTGMGAVRGRALRRAAANARVNGRRVQRADGAAYRG